MFDKLKAQVEENPMGAVAVAALGITAITKLFTGAAAVRNSRTWRKEVNRRIKKSK